MPELSEFIKARADVVGIGLAYEDTERQEIVDFLKRRPVDYPIAQIDVNAPPKDFDIPRGLPTTYLIAPDGTVAKHFLGPIKAKDLEQASPRPRGQQTLIPWLAHAFMSAVRCRGFPSAPVRKPRRCG